MDDIKKAYYDELREKSALARSARVSAYKTKKTKYYSRKELEAMNGPTYQVNLNTCMPYEEFKALPDTLKKEYLQHIVDTWHVGANAIAKMWNITCGTSHPIMKRLGVKTSGQRASKEATEKFFAEFVNTAPAQTKKMTFCNGSLTFIGIPDIEAIMRSVMAFTPAGKSVKITVAVESAE